MTNGLCSDCPPANYPTDSTRCVPCPRRALSINLLTLADMKLAEAYAASLKGERG